MRGFLKRVFAVGIVCLLLLVFLGGISRAFQKEGILDFKSRIQIFQDGSMRVDETIKVVSTGRNIRHGIYRDFPTTYKDAYGNTYRVDFRILKVFRDGRPESYHLKNLSNGVRIYMGKKNVLLRPGIYTYTLVYKTNRQLGFFKDHDELFWNVTGNAWRFPIAHAEAMVVLPQGARITRYTAYTGVQGSRGKAFKVEKNTNGNLVFYTTRTLAPHEGFTIVVAWPKGFVREPTAKEKAAYFIRDNGSIIAAALGLIVLFFYYFLTWLAVGKDPAKGTIIPRFHPPQGLSPAAVRFVMHMGFDPKALAVAIVDMAVKGALRIRQDDDGTYTLERVTKDIPDLSGGEQKVLDALFDYSGILVLKRENHETVQAGKKALEKALKREYEKNYFLRNTRYFIPGLVLTLLTLVGMILTARDMPTAAFMGLWITLWTGGVFFLLRAAVMAWRGKGPRKGAIGLTLFAIPFVVGEIFGLVTFAQAVSSLAAMLFIIVIFLDVLFYHLLKAPTHHGRVIMDEIEGFRLYLETAEEERFKLMHPPEKTPELFEKYLPYAMALDVENAWSQKFESILARATAEGTYQPGWYSGGYLTSGDFSGLASGIGSSLSGAIASSSVAPGSSSGLGGGGGCGGGGGGGGGGGW